MAYGNLAYNNSIFTGDIDKDGTIYSVGTGRERVKVGIDAQREQELLSAMSEMQETLDNWRNVLIENGLLKVPKTAEELAAETAAEQMQFMQRQAQEQAAINQALLKAIEGLNHTVEELKNNERIDGIDSPIADIPSANKRTEDSENNGKKPRTSKVGAGARQKNPA